MPDYRNQNNNGNKSEQNRNSNAPSGYYYHNNQNPNGARNRNAQYNNRNQYNRMRPQEEAAEVKGLSPTVKGIIAIMLTLLIVIIVVLVFVQMLFKGDNSTSTKKGKLTEGTTYTTVTTTKEEVKETKKNTNKSNNDEDDEEDTDETLTGDEQKITCTSAVQLHPTASSKSDILAIINTGDTVTFIRNEGGWYYVDYNGQQGYAYGTFFSAPTTTTTTQAYNYY